MAWLTIKQECRRCGSVRIAECDASGKVNAKHPIGCLDPEGCLGEFMHGCKAYWESVTEARARGELDHPLPK